MGGARLPMTGEIAPDIRFRALTSEEHEMGEEEHPPYDEKSIKRAITRGLEPDGHKLSKTMPRWRMTERDLDDLVEYLKTLDGREGEASNLVHGARCSRYSLLVTRYEHRTPNTEHRLSRIPDHGSGE
jgi:hypothetical protein